MDWVDLLGVPFVMGGDDPKRGLDCWGMAREVCRRAGLLLGDRPVYSDARGSTERVIQTLVRVPVADNLADMLFSDPEGLGFPSHVCSLVQPGWVISTSKRHGPHAVPLARALCSYGVWRVPQ